ncbi:ThuA domain-containing protein [Glacieibacterium sp.]|uniref:ThuA domain-containing protein n=1 Tax=Glacieibacterium sp. TaxID=2860237 RepID=UPI003B006861
MTSNNGDGADKSLSRRAMFGRMAAAATVAGTLPLIANAQPAARPAPAPAPPPQAMKQGGNGPIRVLFISSFHPFDRENLFLALDSMGDDITWTHVEHPAAELFYDPRAAKKFDVYLFYDAFAGRETKPNSRDFVDTVPTAEMQANLKQLMQNGDKGFVFFHHALASWTHTWPAGVNGSNAYVEMMGGAADWGTPLKNIRGKDYPASGYRQGTEQFVSVVDKTHPITQGLGDGFDIVDETYLCPMFEDSVHCLLRTDFVPTADKFQHAPGSTHVGPGHVPGSTMSAWVKTAERSPIVYIQHGHDVVAWVNPKWRLLMSNAIKWAASPESKAWAHANPKRIFV